MLAIVILNILDIVLTLMTCTLENLKPWEGGWGVNKLPDLIWKVYYSVRVHIILLTPLFSVCAYLACSCSLNN